MWGHGDQPGLHDVPEDDHINLERQINSPQHTTQHKDLTSKDKPSKTKRRRSEPYANIGPLLEIQRRGSIDSYHQIESPTLGLGHFRGPVRRGSEPYLNLAQLQIDSKESGSTENIPATYSSSSSIGFTGFVKSRRRCSEPFTSHHPGGSLSRRSSQDSITEEPGVYTFRRRGSEPYTALFGSRGSLGSRSSVCSTSALSEKSSLSEDSRTSRYRPDIGQGSGQAPSYYTRKRRISEPYVAPQLYRPEYFGQQEDEIQDEVHWNMQRRTSFPSEEFKVTTEENAYDLYKSMNMALVQDKGVTTTERMITESPDCEEYKRQSLFAFLPWHDVLYPYVFSCLTLKDLFRLRAVSHCAFESVNEYFTVCPIVNLTRVSQRFSREAFRLVTHQNYRVSVLILRQVKGWLTDDELIPAFSLSTHITKVDLTSCTALSHKSIIALAGRAPGLRELYLRECPWMTMEAIMMIAQNCRQLERFDITGCWALQDEAIITISLYCRNLVYLSIAKIYGVTDNAIHWLARHCTKLQHVNMHGCWRVTDQAIKMLGEYCPDLNMLQVKDCRDITDISLARLRVRGVKVDVPQHPWRLNPETQNLIQSLKLHVQI